MALNLMTLTMKDGSKIEVNPAHIVVVSTKDGLTSIGLSTGGAILVTDPQSKVRERANVRAPDGFG